MPMGGSGGYNVKQRGFQKIKHALYSTLPATIIITKGAEQRTREGTIGDRLSISPFTVLILIRCTSCLSIMLERDMDSCAYYPRRIIRRKVLDGRRIMNCSAPGETRTHDNQIRSQVLYPLSYGRIERVLGEQAPSPP